LIAATPESILVVATVDGPLSPSEWGAEAIDSLTGGHIVVTSRFAAGVGTSAGFRTQAAIDDSPEGLRQTRLAVARAKEGDRDAHRFLYAQYSHNVYAYVRSIVRDDHEAEDITQHVFAKLITTLVKYDDRGVPFFAWLLRLARNAAIDHLRANRMTATQEVFDSNLSCGSDIDRTHTVKAALETLPDDQRQVVVLRHLVGLSPREIADRMGRTEGAIHGLHHRGRRALRAELERLGSAPQTRTPRARVAA
jgi:RNA polymerase sigma-70 factor, ECF subfamily